MHEPIRFGTDGIRGIAGEDPLTPEILLVIGRAVGQWLREFYVAPNVILGRDTRPSGSQITSALTAGLTAEGTSADDTGVITTPGVAYLTRTLHYNLGIVISASHNPFAQNGIKLIGPDGFKLSDGDQAAIEATIDRLLDSPPDSAVQFAEARQIGQYRKLYLQHLLLDHPINALKGLSVVLDCANGAAYELGPAAFSMLGAAVTALGASPTGSNINVRSGSEHIRRQPEALFEAIKAHNADLGIAFDGDADRVIFLSKSGTLVDGDHILGLLAANMKESGSLPGNTVVATDMSNSGLTHYLESRGIKLERTKVGDRHVMARMRERNYRLGGEQAGHIIVLDDNHTAGDGLHIGLRVAALVAQDNEILERLVNEMDKVPQLIASAHLKQQAPLETIEALQPTIERVLSGFKNQGRVNVRYSGTEPNLLRVMVEGDQASTQDEVISRTLEICSLVAEASQTTNPHIDIVDCATGAKIEYNGKN